MEIEFPKNYPNEPFFLRLVTPRCVWCALCEPAAWLLSPAQRSCVDPRCAEVASLTCGTSLWSPVLRHGPQGQGGSL